MVFFFIVGIMAGVALGLRFNVLVLIPAMLLAAAVTVASGLARGHTSGVILFALFGTLASLQAGYFVGCVLQAYFSKKQRRDDIDARSKKLDM
jgi:membrane protein DedA with SNARE-associated domain